MTKIGSNSTDWQGALAYEASLLDALLASRQNHVDGYAPSSELAAFFADCWRLELEAKRSYAIELSKAKELRGVASALQKEQGLLDALIATLDSHLDKKDPVELEMWKDWRDEFVREKDCNQRILDRI